MGVATYDPKQVLVTYAGRTLTGFAEDTKVNVEFDDDFWTTQIGVDGEGARTKSNNRSGTITVRLLQTADDNLFLTAMAEQDRLTNDAALPMQITDGSGRSFHTAETAWISKIPGSEYGITAGPREWVFKTDVLVSSIGGN